MGDDAAKFTIQLIDKVTGPSRKAAASLEKIKDKLDASKGRMSVLTPKQFRTLVATRGMEKLAAGADFVTHQIKNIGLAAVGASTAIGAAVGAWVTQGVVGMATFADSSRRAFASLTGSEQSGAQAMELAVGTAKQLGMSVEQVADQFKGLLAMQFKLGEADEMVRLSADLVSVTGHAESAARAVTAITQIKAKGKLQAEELVGQLAEAGVSTTLVYEALAKRLGKTQDQVKKMISSGKVDATTGIAAIKDAIMHKVHETKPGEAAKAFSDSTITGLMGQLTNLPQQLFLRVAGDLEKDFEGVKDTLREIITAVDNVDTGKIADFVHEVLEMVQQMVPLVMEFASGFADGFDEILDGMRELRGGNGLAATLETARELGRGMAKILSFVLDVIRLISNAIVFLTSPLGETLALVVAVGAVFVKILWYIGRAAELLGGVEASAGTLKVGWELAGAAIRAAGGWILTLVGWIWTGIEAVTVFVAGLINAPVLIAAAVIAAVAALVTLAYTYREEIAKVMLSVWDGITGIVEQAYNWGRDLVYRLIDGITSALTSLWTLLEQVGANIWDFLSGNMSIAELLGAEPAVAGVGGRALAAGYASARPLAQPELTDAVRSGTQSSKVETSVTVNMPDGVKDKAGARDVGRAAGEAAGETVNEHIANSQP